MVIYLQSPQSVRWEQVLRIEYRTAVKSPNLIMGLGRCALQMKNLNVQN